MSTHSHFLDSPSPGSALATVPKHRTVARLKSMKKAEARFPQLFRSPLSTMPNRQNPRIAKMYMRMKRRVSTEATV